MLPKKITYLLILGILAIFSGFTYSQYSSNKKSYSNNIDGEVNRKVDSLLVLMTLEEKIGQTVLYTTEYDVTGPVVDKNYLNYLRDGRLGAMFNATGSAFTRKLQKIAVEETRLGIPLLFGYDVIHGYKTIFPIPMGEASSWDLELVEKSARVSAIEASAEGLHWTFAPMVDVARDPRWGRIAEGAGEDTYLCTKISEARVRGFQGEDLSSDNTILACAKHYAAYGAAQAGRDYHTVDISENTLRNVYLPPFEALTKQGVATFMTSFNEVNGVPATGNKYLLKDILREEWNFDGFVVTDYTSINEMVNHGYAEDLKHAGELAFNSGVDMDMQGGVYLNEMAKSINEGKISEEQLDESVRSILKLKFKLGLFDDPYKYCHEDTEKEIVLSQKNLDIAREVAQRSIVLLQNKKGTLPLKSDSKIALIGPLADDQYHIVGNWIARGDRNGSAVSVREALVARNSKFDYEKGCEISGDNLTGLNNAIKIANASDVVVMVMGESERMSGEAASRTNIKLPTVQQDLIREIRKTGKPLVIVLMNGRPLDLRFESEQADAIVEAWFPGTSGGHAITDVLFGDYNPSGKLTVTFPMTIGQIPIFYNMKNTGRPADIEGANERYTSKYIDAPNKPMYPFGYGLSYTTFDYGEVNLDNNTLTENTIIMASIEITNTGKFDGEEIVQLYIKDMVGSITRPVKELKGFQKIFLKKGESKTLTFEISAEDLKFYKNGAGYINEEGDYRLFIAGSSDHEFTNSFSFKSSQI
ncbi:glycosyl hydrolase [Dokdonia sinensis]|uniref:Periplasmic beta-glucosidase n=1 Tax=Dokdonia sinensis TaxID=2479847 RepID=A0A3M0G3N0_9FLAO|nr:glycoside hydrolase family 3 N-terminal domain-containing protein [Dokdonia sinensis]RMB59405.1 glycosyl hydrolase [Dokdonia sinensis]